MEYEQSTRTGSEAKNKCLLKKLKIKKPQEF
jgi:hypothetical protein